MGHHAAGDVRVGRNMDTDAGWCTGVRIGRWSSQRSLMSISMTRIDWQLMGGGGSNGDIRQAALDLATVDSRRQADRRQHEGEQGLAQGRTQKKSHHHTCEGDVKAEKDGGRGCQDEVEEDAATESGAGGRLHRHAATVDAQ